MATESPADVLSNWSFLIENLQASPMSFFQCVEAAIIKRSIPETESSRVDYMEGGIASAKREYLRIKRGKLIFDVCAAPYGNGFFVSWWLSKPRPAISLIAIAGVIIGYFVFALLLMAVAGASNGFVLLFLLTPLAFCGLLFCGLTGVISDDYIIMLPLIGWLYQRYIKTITYYSIDTATMFQTATHAAVLEAVDELINTKGLRALTDAQRQPRMHDALRG
jgi:hypothetical protein